MSYASDWDDLLVIANSGSRLTGCGKYTTLSDLNMNILHQGAVGAKHIALEFRNERENYKFIQRCPNYVMASELPLNSYDFAPPKLDEVYVR